MRSDDDAIDVRSSGSKGIGLAVGGILTAFFAFLPFVFVVLAYLFVSVYAIVKAASAGPDAADPVTIVVGFVLLATLLVLGLAGAIGFAGRSLTPKRPRRLRGGRPSR